MTCKAEEIRYLQYWPSTVGTTVLIGKSFPDQETVAQSANLYHVM